MGPDSSPFMDTFTDMLPMVGSRRRVKGVQTLPFYGYIYRYVTHGWIWKGGQWDTDPPLLWIHLQTCYPWLDLEGGQWGPDPPLLWIHLQTCYPFMDTDPPLLWIHLQTCYPWLDLEGGSKGSMGSRPSPFMDTFIDMLPMVGSRRRVKGVNGIQTLPFYGCIYMQFTNSAHSLHML